jgi:hypothetical protein
VANNSFPGAADAYPFFAEVSKTFIGIITGAFTDILRIFLIF